MEPAGEAPSTHLLGGGLHHATPVHLTQLVHLAALPAAAHQLLLLLLEAAAERAGCSLARVERWLPLRVTSDSREACFAFICAVLRHNGQCQPAVQVCASAGGTEHKPACAAGGEGGGSERLLRAAPCRSHSTRGRQPHATWCSGVMLAGLSSGLGLVTVGLHAARCMLSSDQTMHCCRDLGRGVACSAPLLPMPAAWQSSRGGSLKRSRLSCTAQ